MLALLFVVVPVIEIYLLIQVGQVIGPWWTILLLIGSGVAGSYLVKLEGGRALRALQQALAERRMPARELADGALILIGGTLLLTPGFLSDIVGAFCILPVHAARRTAGADPAWLSRKLVAASTYAGGADRHRTTPRHRRVGGPGRGRRTT